MPSPLLTLLSPSQGLQCCNDLPVNEFPGVFPRLWWYHLEIVAWLPVLTQKIEMEEFSVQATDREGSPFWVQYEGNSFLAGDGSWSSRCTKRKVLGRPIAPLSEDSLHAHLRGGHYLYPHFHKNKFRLTKVIQLMWSHLGATWQTGDQYQFHSSVFPDCNKHPNQSTMEECIFILSHVVFSFWPMTYWPSYLWPLVASHSGSTEQSHFRHISATSLGWNVMKRLWSPFEDKSPVN